MLRALDPCPPITNCHTSDPLPLLERDVLYGRPLSCPIARAPNVRYKWPAISIVRILLRGLTMLRRATANDAK